MIVGVNGRAATSGRETLALAARHRVDLNLLVDYGWPRFLSHAEEFVRDVKDPDVIMELIEVLDTRDTTAAGGEGSSIIHTTIIIYINRLDFVCFKPFSNQ